MKVRHSAIEEGRQAFRDGLPRSANPYTANVNDPDWYKLFKRYTEWDHGWRDEQVGGEDPIPE
jgi:hypothetical protein